ncbi:MAG: NAD(P)H-binding protein [Rhodocyclaceae bacterium]
MSAHPLGKSEGPVGAFSIFNADAAAHRPRGAAPQRLPDRRRHRVFVTGGTGYIGRQLIPYLAARGHEVVALVRPGRAEALPEGCLAVEGNALDPASYGNSLVGADTLVHLVGVAHPSPAKAAAFRDVDLASVRAACGAAQRAGVAHFVYLSVAQPAPVMGAYIAARREGEALTRNTGLAATILRPWYVMGPGHRWPLVLVPAYWLAERIPATRGMALRLGLVRLQEMVGALVAVVEAPPCDVRLVEVPDIRRLGSRQA